MKVFDLGVYSTRRQFSWFWTAALGLLMFSCMFCIYSGSYLLESVHIRAQTGSSKCMNIWLGDCRDKPSTVFRFISRAAGLIQAASACPPLRSRVSMLAILEAVYVASVCAVLDPWVIGAAAAWGRLESWVGLRSWATHKGRYLHNQVHSNRCLYCCYCGDILFFYVFIPKPRTQQKLFGLVWMKHLQYLWKWLRKGWTINQ